MQCSSCQFENLPGMRFCGQCGTRLPIPLECPICHFQNAVNMRFCGQCGSALYAEVEATAYSEAVMARSGGTALLPAEVRVPVYRTNGTGPLHLPTNGVTALVPTIDERKIVTILFGDISGFTTLAERLDPEEVKHLMDVTFRRLALEVERYEGHVDKFLGDNIMVLFGAPRAHEDDPERAVRCALEMQYAMRELSLDLERTRGFGLRLHIGINTGEVLAGRMGTGREHDYTVMGDAVNLASRLQNAAGPDEILVGEGTYRATSEVIEYRSQGTVPVRGKAEPVPVWEVVKVSTRRGQVRGLPGIEARMIGRDVQLGQIKTLFHRVARDGVLHHIMLMGPAGIGKSRLLWEFEKYLGGLPQPSTFRKGRAQPYGPGVGFRALGEIIKAGFGIFDDDPRPVAADKLLAGVRAVLNEDEAGPVAYWLGTMLGLHAEEGDPDTVRTEIFWALRLFFARQAAVAPLVLALEDLHWADTGMLDFIEYLRETLPDSPILVLTLARPALLESAGGLAWAERGRAVHTYTQIVVDPLSDKGSRKLVHELLGDAELPEAFVNLVLGRAEGNPFFLEEIIRSLVDARILVQRDGHWQLVAGVETIRIPGTVQALVGARVDDLPETEKRLLQGAAVVGRIFWSGALAEMFPQLPADQIEATLVYLERREFIVERGAPVFAGDREYSFRNVLTRDVAYGSVPKALRGEEHARVAAWIEAKAGDRPAEFTDQLAYHYEQSLRLGLDMMTLGETATNALLDKSIHYLRRAGEAAMSRQALDDANEYFEKVMDLLATCGRSPEDPAPGAAADVHPEFLDVLCNHAEVQERLGRYELARSELGQVIAYARADSNRRLLARALLERATVYQEQGNLAALEKDAYEALSIYRFIDDQRGKAEVRLILGRLWHARDNASEAEKALGQARRLFRELGDRLGEARTMNALAGVLQQRDDLAGAKRYTNSALEAFRALGNRREVAYCLRRLANVTGYAADPTEHLRAAEEALAIFRDLGDLRGEALIRLPLAYSAADRRRTAEAEAHARAALSTLRRMGDRRSEAWALRTLALALAPAGRVTEAAMLYSQALDLALAIGDVGILPELYRGQSEVLLALGKNEAALHTAEQARTHAAAADAFSQVITHRALGLARFAVGNVAGAEAAFHHSMTAADQAVYPLEIARSLAAFAVLLCATGRAAEAALCRNQASNLVAGLVWPAGSPTPEEDLLTLARHEGRTVP